MKEREFPEWDKDEGSYSRTATTIERFVEEDMDRSEAAKSLLDFEDRHNIITSILSRSLGKYRLKRTVMSRRTKRFGRINQTYVADELTRAIAGQEPTQKIYDRKENPDRILYRYGMALGLLLDQSGSTRYSVGDDLTRIDLIKHATLTIGRSLEHVGDSSFMYSFHTSRDADPTIMEKLKDENEPWSREIELRVSSLEHTADTDDFNNKDGVAIRFANERLLRSPFENKYLFIVSDGSPNCDNRYYSDEYAQQDTKRALEEGNEKGIQYIYLSINEDESIDDFIRLINENTVFARRYTHLPDVVEGLTTTYEMLKKKQKKYGTR